MNRNYLVILVAVVVTVSGCTGSGNDDDGTAADHSVACSSLGINMPYANAEKAQVVNVGSGSFGNITIRWNYADDDVVTKEFPMPAAGSSETYRSNSSGTLNGAMAIHTDCPSVTGSY